MNWNKNTLPENRNQTKIRMTEAGMDVLYVTKTSIVGEGGGGEKRAKEVTSRLAATGHNVTVVSGKTDRDLPKWTEENGTTIRHVTCTPGFLLDLPRIGFYLPRYLFAFTSLPVLWYLLFKRDFDVVVENMTPFPTLTVILAKLFSTPIVAVQHEFHGRDALEMYDPVTGRIQLVVQNLLRLFHYDQIITPTEHVKDQLAAYGIAPEQITVITNGINYDRFQSVDTERIPTRLVTVSRLGKRKGVDDVLRSFAVIREQHPDTTLDIVGSGPERENLEALAERLGIDDAVTFHGYVSHDRKVELLRCAGIFVFASRQEGFGLVLLEAMATGLPIVARNLPVYHDFFENGTNGYLVRDEEVPREIAERVDELLADPSTLSEIQNVNKETAKRYGWDKTASMTECAIADVCGSL